MKVTGLRFVGRLSSDVSARATVFHLSVIVTARWTVLMARMNSTVKLVSYHLPSYAVVSVFCRFTADDSHNGVFRIHLLEL